MPPAFNGELHFSTDYTDIDVQISAFLVRLYDAFPGRVRAAYLAGSWMDGSAVEYGIQPTSKTDSLSTFHEIVEGEFGRFASNCLHTLKLEWGYEVPPEATDRMHLVELLTTFIRFENDNLERVQEQIYSALASTDDNERNWPEAYLTRVAFPARGFDNS